MGGETLELGDLVGHQRGLKIVKSSNGQFPTHAITAEISFGLELETILRSLRYARLRYRYCTSRASKEHC